MGFFDKVAFWKKKDELGIDNLQIPTGSFAQQPSFNPQGFQDPYAPPGNSWQQPPQQYQPFQSPPMDSFQSSASYVQGRQLEVLSAKLDAIKAALDALNQRMANIEKSREADEYFRRRGGW